MTRRQLYLTGGILCIAISFTIFAYNSIVQSLTKPSQQYLSASPSTPVPGNNTVTPADRSNRSKRTTKPDDEASERKPNAQAQEEWPTPERPAQVPDPTPFIQPTPTPPPKPTPAPTPERLTSAQCEERIAALDQGQYQYIPPECQHQYRAWRTYKADQEREARRREDEARRRQQDAERERRNREEEARRKRQELLRGIEKIIRP